MYTLKQSNCPTSPKLQASCSKVGDLMRIIEINNVYGNQILLHIYDGFVSLDDPTQTWEENCSLTVELLKKEESITLTVK